MYFFEYVVNLWKLNDLNFRLIILIKRFNKNICIVYIFLLSVYFFLVFIIFLYRLKERVRER